ncbi:MAG: ribosome maturation factor RimM [Pseudomonadota bacterium]|jgi:16S rRNA processing protein RimM
MNAPLADDEIAWPDDAIEVARVVEAWGIKGWIRVQPYAADAQAVFSSRRWFLQPPEGRPRPKDAPPLPRLLRITQAREHGEGVVASAQELPDRTAAEALKGARIFVSRASFPSAAQDEYYWVDLLGLKVLNRDGAELGVVTDLLDTGAHSVLRLSYTSTDAQGREREAERLIPFVAAYIDRVDLPGRCVHVDWGLDY